MEGILDDIRNQRSLNQVKQLEHSIIDCAKNIKSNDQTFNISTFSEVCDKLSDVMSEYVSSVKHLEAAQKTFVSLQENLAEDAQAPNGGDPVDLAAFEVLFRQQFDQNLTEVLTEGNEAQIALDAIVRPNQPPPRPPQPDQDIYVEQNSQREIPKDPITKRNIKIAVRSKKCNHIYDQESIKSYISHKEKNKSRVQCPVAGCSNRAMKSNELVLDDETNALIQSLV